MSKIPLQLSGGESDPQNAPRYQQVRTPVSGWLSIIFGLLSIFGPAFIFAPLGILVSIIAIFRGQAGLGFLGLIMSVAGILTSPVLMGLLGAGAVFMLFDWQEILKPVYDFIGNGMDV